MPRRSRIPLGPVRGPVAEHVLGLARVEPPVLVADAGPAIADHARLRPIEPVGSRHGPGRRRPSPVAAHRDRPVPAAVAGHLSPARDHSRRSEPAIAGRGADRLAAQGACAQHSGAMPPSGGKLGSIRTPGVLPPAQAAGGAGQQHRRVRPWPHAGDASLVSLAGPTSHGPSAIDRPRRPDLQGAQGRQRSSSSWVRCRPLKLSSDTSKQAIAAGRHRARPSAPRSSRPAPGRPRSRARDRR